MAKPGDIVRFLNTTGGGKVTRVSGQLAYVEDEDGFETPVLMRECVVVGQQPVESPTQTKLSTPERGETTSPAQMPTPESQVEEIEIEEVPGGDKLNVVIAYEPVDIKNPTTSAIDAYIVNDSNYFLSFTYLTRASSSQNWTMRYAGVVEPNIQLLLGDVPREMLSEMERIAVQIIAYKRDREFEIKKPVDVRLSLDVSKFFKLHCFKENEYFENPVIAIDIVRDDMPVNPTRVDGDALKKAMLAKKATDKIDVARRPVRKKHKSPQLHDGNIVVDLHIQELIDNTRGLSNADILNLQVDEFRRVMDENLKNKGCKIVFIHGKGEGVLRQALLKELNHRYKGNDVQDASFREYGFGATQVTIK